MVSLAIGIKQAPRSIFFPNREWGGRPASHKIKQASSRSKRCCWESGVYVVQQLGRTGHPLLKKGTTPFKFGLYLNNPQTNIQFNLLPPTI